MRTLLVELRDEWVRLEEQIDASNRKLAQFAKQEEGCRRLLTVPGVGPLTATALTAAIGNRRA
jgi:transposase